MSKEKLRFLVYEPLWRISMARIYECCQKAENVQWEYEVRNQITSTAYEMTEYPPAAFHREPESSTQVSRLLECYFQQNANPRGDHVMDRGDLVFDPQDCGPIILESPAVDETGYTVPHLRKEASPPAGQQLSQRGCGMYTQSGTIEVINMVTRGWHFVGSSTSHSTSLVEWLVLLPTQIFWLEGGDGKTRDTEASYRHIL
ncbi:hypothetical protein C8R44DRAFT_859061 [Mycena epipterygia]|nr:hypothetical protein C8R44DRAFT_859061 [Mycena epipterygia]